MMREVVYPAQPDLIAPESLKLMARIILRYAIALAHVARSGKVEQAPFRPA